MTRSAFLGAASAVALSLALVGCTGSSADPTAGSETTELAAISCAKVAPSQPTDLFLQVEGCVAHRKHASWSTPFTVATGRTCGPIREYEVWGVFWKTSSVVNCDNLLSNQVFRVGSTTANSIAWSEPSDGFTQFTVRARNDWGWSDFAPWSSGVCDHCAFP